MDESKDWAEKRERGEEGGERREERGDRREQCGVSMQYRSTVQRECAV
jgi:hypothetical protein